jgi:hypothetical protein
MYFYHATPANRLDSILSNGLEPRNEWNNYTPRIYMTRTLCTARRMATYLRDGKKIKRDYAILRVRLSRAAAQKTKEDLEYWNGVYVHFPIPARNIQVVGKVKLGLPIAWKRDLHCSIVETK